MGFDECPRVITVHCSSAGYLPSDIFPKSTVASWIASVGPVVSQESSSGGLVLFFFPEIIIQF